MAGATRGAAKAPKNETPEAKFVRVGGTRVSKVFAALDTLAAVGKSPLMVYTTEQADKAIAAIDAKYEAAKTALRAGAGPKAAKGTRAKRETFSF